jgi:hypothetical protein
MSQDIENQLRRALRAVDPPADFTARVMRALPPRPASADVVSLGAVKTTGPGSTWRHIAAPTALAASLLVAFVLGRQVALEQQERQQLAGIEASRKLMQALRVTSQKLDLAYEAVQRAPEPPAEENRS